MQHPGAKVDVVDHDLSCDNEDKVKKWILNTHAPTYFVEDISDMKDTAVWDVKSEEFVITPSSGAVVCGWVCHNACLPQPCWNNL